MPGFVDSLVGVLTLVILWLTLRAVRDYVRDSSHQGRNATGL